MWSLIAVIFSIFIWLMVFIFMRTKSRQKGVKVDSPALKRPSIIRTRKEGKEIEGEIKEYETEGKRFDMPKRKRQTFVKAKGKEGEMDGFEILENPSSDYVKFFLKTGLRKTTELIGKFPDGWMPWGDFLIRPRGMVFGDQDIIYKETSPEIMDNTLMKPQPSTLKYELEQKEKDLKDARAETRVTRKRLFTFSDEDKFRKKELDDAKHHQDIRTFHLFAKHGELTPPKKPFEEGR